MDEKTYIAIDLKSFFASVECTRRALDPLTTNLVVADASRTEKTICLAVTPSLKTYGISGRARMFEVIARVREVNRARLAKAPGHRFKGASYKDTELKADAGLALDYIVAKPRMALYKETSVKIYELYLKYVAPEDIHVYSVDEVFIDATKYLSFYGMSARELARTMILDVLRTTGITATAGIGTNLYLCKVALDIMAKHVPADEYGVRIAELDEMSYRRELWGHRPITDFWRVGRGYSSKLAGYGMNTMGDVARCSLRNEDLLYSLFGVNAELLIDHAWGWEPCTIAEIKAYRPQSSSTSSGQVLSCPYPYEKALIIVKEMTELAVLDLVERGLVTDQLVLDIGYDTENIKSIDGTADISATDDRYGRRVPKPAHGTGNIGRMTSSTKLVTDTAVAVFERIADRRLSVRRINLTLNNLTDERSVSVSSYGEQLDIFTDGVAAERRHAEEAAAIEREKKIQHAVIGIKKKFGKNAIIKGLDLEDGATTIARNGQIGGHKA